MNKQNPSDSSSFHCFYGVPKEEGTKGGEMERANANRAQKYERKTKKERQRKNENPSTENLHNVEATTQTHHNAILRRARSLRHE